ncbi:MAG: sigma-70 family RNA polymerase sigma factor [Planctomycetes bacterium]|nr:sigma-70 family RNA polymerase sigma factor [Planctomycetota bacterium]
MLVHEPPETRESLLIQLRDAGNRESWFEFAAIYRPMVYRMARRRGLQDADAQDLAQRVLLSVAGSISEWKSDSERGRFRSWLARVARNAIIDTFRREKPDAAQGGSTIMQQLTQEPVPADDELEHEHRREVFRWAAKQVRWEFEDSTWIAFWLTTVKGKATSEVAEELGKSVGSIYTAKSRVMKRLQEKVQEHS